MNPAIFWAGFHLRRNLLRRGTLVWVIAVPVLVAILRFLFDVPHGALGQLMLIFLVPLMSLAFGGGVLREEVEDQTLTYGFTRPVNRAALFGARLVAAIGPVLIAIVPAVIIAADGFEDGARMIAAAVLGTLAHASLFGLWGLLLKRPTWLGLAYVLVWEQALQGVPGWLSSLTLRSHMRNLAELGQPSSFPMVSASGPGPWWVSVLVLVGLVALCVTLSGLLVRRRELVLTR